MTTAAILQSNYIPWRGYFHLVHDADIFVFYDDVQYTHDDWRNRNRIKTPHGSKWLTIPAGRDKRRLICDVEITDQTWKKKHRKSIEQNYRHAPFFENYARALDCLYDTTITNLSLYNQRAIQLLASLLGISTVFVDSRTLQPNGKKTDRLLDILEKIGATTYLSGPSAKAYLEEEKLRDAGLELRYISYSYSIYPQLHPPFDPYVSILDLLFMSGPEAPKHIWDRHRRHFTFS